MQNYFDATKPPLYTSDFHYFRISPEKWILMLTRLAQMGVNIIMVTVPWGFHEFKKGTVDLSGATNARRDVVGLMELCAGFNLPCILKPGPYTNNCRILNDGLPYWLGPNSNSYEADLPVATESWYRALSQALISRQWPAGPIVALQIDAASTQEPQPAYSKQLTEIKWPIWLRKRYQGLEALNAAYGTTYRTMSQVQFPESWSQEATPLEEDARIFLEEVKAETQHDYSQLLIDAGWQVPVYPSVLNTQPQLPAMQEHSLVELRELSALDLDNTILNLQDPIQIDPDPTDVGSGPVWANNAPIRADGSLRRKFWDVRQFLWSHTLPNVSLEAGLVTASFEAGGLATAGRDMPLKISLTKGTKPVAYRLRLDGELSTSDSIKAARGKLSGPYLTEDDAAQTDLILYLNDPTSPLSGFLLTYLKMLLKAQIQALARCAELAAQLGRTLEPAQDTLKAAPPKPARPTSYTLAEARRGLSEADRILRKAMASIGGLEAGFDSMLGKSSSDMPEPASASAAISPEIFEGRTREILIEVGKVCANSIPHLQLAAETLQTAIDRPQDFTVEQYRQNYTRAVTTAQSVRDSLLEFIALLRVEMASEKLPLVAWRVHNQIQEIAESLRWGVLRG